MAEICAVFNTFGRGQKENVDQYVEGVESILAQGVDVDVAISACVPSDPCLARLREHFRGRVFINVIRDIVPLGISFNHTIKRMVEKNGQYNAYLYMDSGISFRFSHKPLERLYDTLKSGPHIGIAAAMPSTDSGFRLWELEYRPGIARVLPPKAFNMHCQLWSRKFYEAYGPTLLPDIFANDCSESVFCYLCAAIGTHMVINQDIMVEHFHYMDGASAGSRAGFFYKKPGTTKENFTPIWQRGREFGMGFEWVDPEKKWPHNPDLFTEDGFAKHDGLLPYIKENLFTHLDYDSLNTEFISK